MEQQDLSRPNHLINIDVAVYITPIDVVSIR